MNPFGDGPPAQDARPFLPTDIDSPYPPAQDARPVLPTEVESPYPPAHAGPVYQSTRTGPGEPAVDQGSGPAPGFMKYGPGVPPAPPADAGQTAERIWRTGRLDQPPRRRPRRARGLAGAALTVILLAASAVVLYLRLHHAPFHVTGVEIARQTRNGCAVNVTGQISTNGAAGNVTYQWLIQPDQQAPQPLSQSVVAGQDAVDVTVAVQGSGHGRASRTVTLEVLGPDSRTTSTRVNLHC
jgi:hypothetical protein